jgi:hypothetical protein
MFTYLVAEPESPAPFVSVMVAVAHCAWPALLNAWYTWQ